MSESKIEISQNEFQHVSSSPNDVGICPERLKRIDEYLRDSLEKKHGKCMSLAIVRKGELVYSSAGGVTKENGDSSDLQKNPIYRIYSMTKVITSTAIMMLVEQNKIALNDPVSRFIPAFASAKVWQGEGKEPTPAQNPITIQHLLTHTSGITYAGMGVNDRAFEQKILEAKINFNPEIGGKVVPEISLLDMCNILAQVPLKFEPGTAWEYGNSTDVLGCVVEQASEQTLQEFFVEHIFDPLEMNDTRFQVDPSKADRFTDCYVASPDENDNKQVKLTLADSHDSSPYLTDHKSLLNSGGGGLLSTLPDYLKFCQMLLGKGRGTNGNRILGRNTVDQMIKNHLPNGQTISQMGSSWIAELNRGYGHGLGATVLLDAPIRGIMANEGEFAWGGMAGTVYWVDYKEELVCVMMTQVINPFRMWDPKAELRAIVNQTIVD